MGSEQVPLSLVERFVRALVWVAVGSALALSVACHASPTGALYDGGVLPEVDATANIACPSVNRKAQLDIPYASQNVPGWDALTKLDVYPAENGCSNPVVIWVHGGGWSVGDKQHNDSNKLYNKVNLFNRAGYTFVAINYRLTNDAVQPPVKMPMHVEDAADAFAYVRTHAAEFGGDPARIAMLGHSAGAHMAALLVTAPEHLARRNLVPSDVRCIGSYDVRYDAAETVDNNDEYTRVFGSVPSEQALFSPQNRATMRAPPTQLACRGNDSRIAACQRFARTLTDLGGHARTIDASALDHEGVNESIGAPGDRVMTAPVMDFLNQCFRGSF